MFCRKLQLAALAAALAIPAQAAKVADPNSLEEVIRKVQ